MGPGIFRTFCISRIILQNYKSLSTSCCASQGQFSKQNHVTIIIIQERRRQQIICLNILLFAGRLLSTHAVLHFPSNAIFSLHLHTQTHRNAVYPCDSVLRMRESRAKQLNSVFARRLDSL